MLTGSRTLLWRAADIRHGARCLFALGLLGTANARTVLSQKAIRVRALPSAIARSTEAFDTLVNLRVLRSGRVIVNEPLRLRLSMLDGTLSVSAVLADTAPGSRRTYGPRPAAILPFVGDSSLLVDGVAGALIVVDPLGELGRIMSPPKESDLNNIMTGAIFGTVAFDSRG